MTEPFGEHPKMLCAICGEVMDVSVAVNHRCRPQFLCDAAREWIDANEAYEWMSPQQAQRHAARLTELLVKLDARATEMAARIADAYADEHKSGQMMSIAESAWGETAGRDIASAIRAQGE